MDGYCEHNEDSTTCAKCGSRGLEDELGDSPPMLDAAVHQDGCQCADCVQQPLRERGLKVRSLIPKSEQRRKRPKRRYSPKRKPTVRRTTSGFNFYQRGRLK